MRKSNHEAIRKLLRSCDGMTAPELADAIGLGKSSGIYRALKGMPDAYIDRWVKRKTASGFIDVAVWCVVVPPPDCPKPERK